MEQTFIKAVNELIKSREDLLPIIKKIIQSGKDISEQEKKQERINMQMKAIVKQLSELVDVSSKSPFFAFMIDPCSEEYGFLDQEYKNLEAQINGKKSRLWKIQSYCQTLNSIEVMISYDESKFRNMVDRITVFENKTLRFKLWNGPEFTIFT